MFDIFYRKIDKFHSILGLGAIAFYNSQTYLNG